MQKIKIWARKNIETLISCGVLFFVMLAIFMWKGFWPFGNKSFAIYDLSNQIVPLASLIIDFFQGKASLFYTNRLACGLNTFATMVYFIMSPLYLLLFLGGRSNMLYMVNLVIVAYLFCMVISINYMMKKLFKIKSYLQIILSIAYCFCGYVLQNYTFTTWLNFLIVLPLMIVAFKRMIDTNKYMWFSILTCIYIVSCFGVGTTTHFVLLAVYYLYILLCVDKLRRKEVLTRLTVALLVGILFSSVILVPVGFSATLGSRSGQLFDYIFTTAVNRESEVKIMMILLEFSFTIFNLYYMLFSNKKDKFNIFLSIVLLGLLVIHFVDACLLLLNFGLNIGYNTRLGFMYSVATVVSVCKLITDFDKKEIEQSNNTQKSKFLKWTVFVLSIIVLALVVFIIATKMGVLNNFSQRIAIFNYDNDFGILPIFLWIVGVFFVFVCILFAFKKLDKKIMRFSLAMILCCQAIFGAVMFGCRNFTAERFTLQMQLTKDIDDYDKVKYSVNNMKLLFDTSATSGFTSMLPKKTWDTYKALGYSSKSNYVSNDGGTLFTDSIMGIKYYVTTSNQNSHSYTLLNSGEYVDDNGVTINNFLYKYNYSTSGAFLINQDYQWDFSKNSFENQNALAKAMGATENIFEVADLNTLIRSSGDIKVTTTNLYKSGNEYKTYDNVSGKVKFVTKNRTDNVYYLLLGEGNGELYKTVYAKNTNPLVIYKIGDGQLNIPQNTSWDFSKIFFAKLNYANYEAQLEKIRNNEVKIEYKSNGCALNIDVSENKKLFVSNVNIKGMKAKVNGQKTAVQDVATGFVGVDLNVGKNNVEIYYSSPILLPSLLIVSVLIGLAIVVIILYNKNKLNWLNKIISYAYMVYGVCFVCILYVFTGVITIVKLL